MNWFAWLALAFILFVAGVSIYRAFQSPVFYAGLARLAAAALLPAILKQMSPEDLNSWHELQRSGPSPQEERAWHRARQKRLRAAKN